MKKYIIFDLDGTLVDSNNICVAILQEMLDERGSVRRIDDTAAAVHMSLGGERMVRALLDECCVDPTQDLADFRARYAIRTTQRDSLFAGVESGLKALHNAGFVLAICSNKPVDLCFKVLEDTDIATLFYTVVGGAPGLRSKPAPDLLDATLAQLEVSASDCLFVGDSDLDFQIATAAGMPFCFMTYGYAEPGWMPPAGECFAQFSDLVATLIARGVPAAA